MASPVVGGLALLAVLRIPLMTLLFPHYVDYAPLVVPIALQSVFVALSIGPLCVLNGLRQGSAVFRMQVLRTSALVAAAVVGMRVAGVVGLAWALALASSLVWLQLLVVTHRAITRTVPAEQLDGDQAPVAP
jgi:O-antigen/teichoic acid export membrane protein